MKSLLGLCETIADLGLLMEIEDKQALQNRYDGDGCDETCGLCSPKHPEVICWWHHGKSCQIPRRFA